MSKKIHMMKCGHAANAEQFVLDGRTIPICVMCDCTEIVEPPDITGRKSRCCYFGSTHYFRGKTETCTSEVDSNMKLPFFEHLPHRPFDEHYCGCRGWD